MARRALLVGINDYPGSENDLYGCVNDATNVYDVLVKYFAYAPSDIAVLTNGRATKAAILDGLAALVGRARAGDGDGQDGGEGKEGRAHRARITRDGKGPMLHGRGAGRNRGAAPPFSRRGARSGEDRA